MKRRRHFPAVRWLLCSYSIYQSATEGRSGFNIVFTGAKRMVHPNGKQPLLPGCILLPSLPYLLTPVLVNESCAWRLQIGNSSSTSSSSSNELSFRLRAPSSEGVINCTSQLYLSIVAAVRRPSTTNR